MGNADAQIAQLKALELLLNKKGQNIIRQDIKNLEYGIAGEKTIAFELRTVPGFGEVKVNMYGEEILGIIEK